MTMKYPECHAMIDDTRHAPFLSVSSLSTHRALKRSNFSFSVKLVCIIVMDKSNKSNISLTALNPSSCAVRRSTVFMRRHFYISVLRFILLRHGLMASVILFLIQSHYCSHYLEKLY